MAPVDSRVGSTLAKMATATLPRPPMAVLAKPMHRAAMPSSSQTSHSGGAAFEVMNPERRPGECSSWRSSAGYEA